MGQAHTGMPRNNNNGFYFDLYDRMIGIPEKDIPNLFKEFFRASNAKKARITRSGVGLAGIKTIVERFQGRLELKTTEAVGSTFTVFLPLHAEK